MRKGFTIHHNGPQANCVGQPHARCEQFWRAVRDFHVNEKGWSGIAYSFGTCPHGVPFVGQGWDRRQFANGADIVPPNDGADSEWYTVLAFVGGGEGTGEPEEIPTAAMVNTVRNLIAEGRRTRRCGLAVKPHSDFKRKPCPGETFTRLTRAWDDTPFGAPPIPRPDLEVDDMFLYSTPGKPVMFCAAGKTVGLNESGDLPTFAQNEIKHFKLDDDTYDVFLRTFPRA
jgi:hypothetical protein